MKTILTDEQKQWFMENYGVMTKTAICKELHLSLHSFRVYAIQLGIATEREKEMMLRVADRKSNYLEPGATEICLHCQFSINHCFCSEKDTEVGALWKKKCFVKKLTTQENES